MIEIKDRMYNCPKLRKIIHIFEDYEVTEDHRTLVRCSCPVYTGTSPAGASCNGLNHRGEPCCYAHWQESE